MAFQFRLETAEGRPAEPAQLEERRPEPTLVPGEARPRPEGLAAASRRDQASAS
jgi:hypothetical protein